MIKPILESLDAILAQEQRRLRSQTDQLTVSRKIISDKQDAIKLCELCLQEQTGVVVHIEDMDNAFLSAFNDDLTFKFETAYKTDKVTVAGFKPTIYNNGTGNRPSEGQRTIAATGLQVSFLKLKPISQVMLFDEHFADVAPPITQELIELLGEVLDQVILITHQDITFPVTYEVTKRNKISEVKRI